MSSHLDMQVSLLPTHTPEPGTLPSWNGTLNEFWRDTSILGGTYDWGGIREIADQLQLHGCAPVEGFRKHPMTICTPAYAVELLRRGWKASA